MSYAEQYGMIDERNVIDSEKFGAHHVSKSSRWEKMAHLVYMNYGMQVDWEEGFFICPECGEPIYECDWDTSDLIDGDRNFICPVCEGIID